MHLVEDPAGNGVTIQSSRPLAGILARVAGQHFTLLPYLRLSAIRIKSSLSR